MEVFDDASPKRPERNTGLALIFYAIHLVCWLIGVWKIAPLVSSVLFHQGPDIIAIIFYASGILITGPIVYVVVSKEARISRVRAVVVAAIVGALGLSSVGFGIIIGWVLTALLAGRR